jgi:hypothetical protein
MACGQDIDPHRSWRRDVCLSVGRSRLPADLRTPRSDVCSWGWLPVRVVPVAKRCQDFDPSQFAVNNDRTVEGVYDRKKPARVCVNGSRASA